MLHLVYNFLDVLAGVHTVVFGLFENLLRLLIGRYEGFLLGVLVSLLHFPESTHCLLRAHYVAVSGRESVLWQRKDMLDTSILNGPKQIWQRQISRW